MNTLPTTPPLSGGIRYERQPSRTWYLDHTTGRIRGEVDGLSAISQAVDILLHTERLRWQVYRPSSGVTLADLPGQDADFVAVELHKRIKEGLLMDDRVTGISDYRFTASGDTLTVQFVVNTVYGEIPAETEVMI